MKTGYFANLEVDQKSHAYSIHVYPPCKKKHRDNRYVIPDDV